MSVHVLARSALRRALCVAAARGVGRRNLLREPRHLPRREGLKSAREHAIQIFIFIYIPIHIHTYIYIYTHIYIYTYIHTSIYEYMNASAAPQRAAPRALRRRHATTQSARGRAAPQGAPPVVDQGVHRFQEEELSAGSEWE